LNKLTKNKACCMISATAPGKLIYGKAERFRHGEAAGSSSALAFAENIDLASLPEPETPDGDYELLSEEDLEELLNTRKTFNEHKT